MCFIFAMTGGWQTEYIDKGSVAPGEFGKQVCQFITRKSSITGAHWKLKTTREKRESVKAQIS